jgi:homoserine O-succinyltransferase
MPVAAREATERQWASLLEAAAPEVTIRLAIYTLADAPHSDTGATPIRSSYASVDALMSAQVDGLIVTGAEPLKTNLRDEAYWETFGKVVEWARENTHSTIWSCLAAHATLLHCDGISRIKSRVKHFGVMNAERVSANRLTEGTPTRFRIPHSRWNGVAESELLNCGYTVLTRTEDAGVDMFVKQHESLFVFLQGHPEYDADTLQREYCRDISRYLKRESDVYPEIPCGYYDATTAEHLGELRAKALTSRDAEVLAEVSKVLAKFSLENTWRETAVAIYRNWLEHICAEKALPVGKKMVA